MTTSTESAGDGVILARLRSGNTEGVELLDCAYRERLLRFGFRYLGSWDDAEDVVQEVMGRVATTTNHPEKLRPWLFKITRNACFTLLRRRGCRPECALETQAGLVASMTGHLTGLVKEERRARLVTVLGELSIDQAEVLRLRYTERLSRPEIAEVLDIPPETVKSRLFEAVKVLRRHASLG